MIGPVAAAGLVAFVGEGACFTLDALSSIAVIAALFAMRVASRIIPPREGHGLREMKDGLAYVAKHPSVRAVLLLFAATSLLASSYATLLPLIAGGALHGGPHTLGVLMGAAGCGALTGALALASRTGQEAQQQEEGGPPPQSVGLQRPLVAAIGLGSALLLLELAHSTLIAAPLLFVVGACLMVVSTSTNTIIQTTVEPDMKGRVTSLWAFAFFAGAPVGALVEGELAKLVGPVHMFALAGAGCLLTGLALTRQNA